MLAEHAAGIFARLGDRAGEGRALEEAAHWLLDLNRDQEAIAARKRALELLPESEPQYRLAAFCNLGYAYLSIGDVHEAESCLALAEPLIELGGAQDRAKVLWLRASIYRKLGRPDKAESLMRQVVRTFMRLHFGEATLASLDLVEVLLEQGKSYEAWEVCMGMFPLEESNPVIQAAVGKLIRSGLAGLRLALVRKVRKELEEVKQDARTRREWRALAVGS